MSACTCCPETLELEMRQEAPVQGRKSSLFNWVTVLLVTGWVAIVTFAMEHAASRDGALPTVESFISSLL